jgi:hypothetical protein
MTKKSNIVRTANNLGLLVEANDGGSRYYNFFTPPSSGNPYTLGRFLGSARGIREAEIFLAGYAAAYYHADKSPEYKALVEAHSLYALKKDK